MGFKGFRVTVFVTLLGAFALSESVHAHGLCGPLLEAPKDFSTLRLLGNKAVVDIREAATAEASRALRKSTDSFTAIDPALIAAVEKKIKRFDELDNGDLRLTSEIVKVWTDIWALLKANSLFANLNDHQLNEIALDLTSRSFTRFGVNYVLNHYRQKMELEGSQSPYFISVMGDLDKINKRYAEFESETALLNLDPSVLLKLSETPQALNSKLLFGQAELRQMLAKFHEAYK